MDINSYPKAELHVHLDGSIRPETFLELAIENKEYLPIYNKNLLKKYLRFRKGMNLVECLSKFSLTNLVMQTPEALERITYELCEDMAKDNVMNLEIRYCPSLHLHHGMDYSKVIDSVANGIVNGRNDFNINANQILTIVRNKIPGIIDEPVKEGYEILDHARYGRLKFITGIDLAGDEYNYPPKLFKDVFDMAKLFGVKYTIHAGEGDNALENLKYVVKELEPQRIGHGIAMRRDKKLMEEIAEKEITIECCPTSNMHTGAIKSLSDHPIKLMLQNNVKVAVCADNTLLSNTTTSKEIEKLVKYCGLSLDDVAKILKNSHEGFFI